MAVHIRLSRVGAKKAPIYRVIVADQRCPREGRFIERIGTYDPAAAAGGLIVNRERLEYWRGRGAQPSNTVEHLLKHKQVAQAEGAVAAPAKPAAAGKAS